VHAVTADSIDLSFALAMESRFLCPFVLSENLAKFAFRRTSFARIAFPLYCLFTHVYGLCIIRVYIELFNLYL
jgi:hypothetical protein